MRVLFITKYGMLAASSRTRVFQYLPFLEGEGFESRVLTVLPDRAIGGSQTLVTRNRWRKILYYLWAAYRTAWCGWRAWAMAAAHDVLFVQKVIFPAPVRWLMRWRRSAVVFDFDDAIFTTELRDGNWLSRWKQRRNSAGLPAMLALADLAIVENEYTAGYARQHCRRHRITGGRRLRCFLRRHRVRRGRRLSFFLLRNRLTEAGGHQAVLAIELSQPPAIGPSVEHGDDLAILAAQLPGVLGVEVGEQPRAEGWRRRLRHHAAHYCALVALPEELDD